MRSQFLISQSCTLVTVCLLAVACQGVYAQESAGASVPPASDQPGSKQAVDDQPNVSDEAIATADDSKTEAVETTPVRDIDFEFMGEFEGQLKAIGGDTTDGDSQVYGLQVRAMGDGQFAGILITGGLPSQDNVGNELIPLAGRRANKFLILSSDNVAVFLTMEDDAESVACRILSPKGETIGTMARRTRTSPTLGAVPPDGAVVLFDGSGADEFTPAKLVDGNLLGEGTVFRKMFQDFDLHVEFRLPFMPGKRDQARANSGIYLNNRYECQVLDSFAREPRINGLGAIYQIRKPALNMALLPATWQTYDISFTSPRWNADGSKSQDARISSWVNGVLVQDNVSVPRKTGNGAEETATLLPTKLQDHGNPVRFRNIWLIDRGLSQSEFPVLAESPQ
jgi:hypothetical protein